MFDAEVGLAQLYDRAEVRLINSTSSKLQLREALRELNLVDEQRLRPSWDQYFMQLASLAAHRSNCMKRRVGCVLVRDKRVISTGYNGTPRNLKNCNQGGCEFLKPYSSLILTCQKAFDATTVIDLESACPHVCASMPKRMLSSKQVGSASGRAPRYFATHARVSLAASRLPKSASLKWCTIKDIAWIKWLLLSSRRVAFC